MSGAARRWWVRGLAGVLAGALLAAGGAAWWWQRALAPAAPQAASVEFQVAPGATLRSVARDLEARGVVRNARALTWLARWRGQAAALRAGEYELSPSWPAERVLDAIVRGEVKTYEVVLPPGWTAREMAARLAGAGLVDEQAFLALVNDPASAEAFGVEGPTLEGYLFPETYRLPRGLPARRVAGILVEHFLAAWRPLAEEAAAQGLSMREVVTLASIVEKETGAPEERPLIAAVFRNRLARGMRLESDPTVIYGIPDFDGNLRRIHLDDESNPWNTYRNAGLPPTPIANPGREALEAVVRPAKTEYLFFVSRNDGTHVFSRTYAEHDAYVNRYQRRRQSAR